jgi:hypothetical protein
VLVVHGLLSVERGVGLWAEDPALPTKSASQSLRTARPHPFAASLTLTPTTWEAILLLPSLVSAPLDSPDLLRDVPRRAAKTEPGLLPWRVPVSWLEPAEAIRLLEGDDAPDLRAGQSMRYLAAIVEFASDLVDRGRVLPTVELAKTGGCARWRPVVQGPDLMALHRLAAGMPPVCRAEAEHPDDREGRDPHLLVSAAIEVFVDAIVRSRLTGPDSVLDLRPVRRGRVKRTVADSWLTALTAASPEIDALDKDLDELAAAIATWDEVGPAGPANARLTIRLLAPGPDDTDGTATVVDSVPDVAAWRLEFLLQSLEDPSLQVPADQVWDGETGLDRWLDQPEDLLLTELGRASRIYPELKQALDQARPSYWDTDTLGAHQFLTDAAPQLDAAGIGLQLPSWWSRRHRLALRLSAATPIEGVVEGSAGFGRDQLVDFRWQLAIGDEVLSEQELEALADAKSPLVRVRGQWISADPDQLRRSLEFLRHRGSGQMTAGHVLDLAARHDTGLDTPVPVDAVSAQGWLGALLSGQPSEMLLAGPRPTISWRPFVPTSSAAWSTCRSCPGSVSVPAWRTTWVWARRSRPSPSSSATGSRMESGPRS